MIPQKVSALVENKNELISQYKVRHNRGKNKVRLINISPDIDLLYFHFRCRKEGTRMLRQQKKQSYFFVLNLKDKVDFQINEDQVHIAQKNDLFIFRNASCDLNLNLKKNKRFEFLAIRIKKELLEKLITQCEVTDYSDFLKTNESFTHMKANLEVMERLHQMNKLDGRIGAMEVLGHAYVLINLIIRQYLQELKMKTAKKSSLMAWELKAIHEISAEIRKNPERPYSVTEISRKIGVSIPRLQLGFKEEYNMTVGLYIKEMRLQEAERLLRKTERNISEVVYSIGLSSRSYFSRIFKEKYNCSPSTYKHSLSLS